MKISNYLQKVNVVMAALALTLGVNILTPAPANAVTPSCGAGKLCFWDGTNYTTLIYQNTVPPKGYCADLPSSAANKASSYFNNSAGELWLYDSYGCTGALVGGLNPYTYDPSLSSPTSNKTNSFWVYRYGF